MIIHFNNHWKLCFTNLAFKFLEIVMKSTTNNLFFNFKMNPFHQTSNMNSSTRSRTLTRIKEIILVNLNLLKANFAWVFLHISFSWIQLHWFTTSIYFLFTFWSPYCKSSIDKNLTYIVLNSSNFNSLTRLQLISFWLTIYIFDFSYNDVSFLLSSGITLYWFVSFYSITLKLFWIGFFSARKM